MREKVKEGISRNKTQVNLTQGKEMQGEAEGSNKL